MAGTRRKVEAEELIPAPKLLYIIDTKLNNLRDKALASFLYMSGCRISEILGTTKTIKHYIKEKGKFILDLEGMRAYNPEENTITKVKPLTKESIEIKPEIALMLIHDVPCLKRREDIPKRYIPVYIPKVRAFFEIFMQYYKTLQPGQPLFSITRQRAWQIMKSKLGLFNHFFIHNRTTHLVVHDGFSDQDLKQYRGWSSTLPATSYVHMRWQDLARKMGANVKE